jgi:uncharacterized protein with GYD domain
MPLFQAHVSCTAEALAALVSNPRDRLDEVLTPLLQDAGGRPHAAWFSFGEYDVVAVSSAIRTTPPISTDEAVETFSRAKTLF